MKSLYYQFVNLLNEIPSLIYLTICIVLFIGSLIMIMRFFKIYNGTQKRFEKLSLLVLSILLFIFLVYLVSVRIY